MGKLAVFAYLALVILLVSAPQVLASDNVTCTGTLTNATAGNVTVPAGAVCRLNGSTVKGSVSVLQNAYFEASHTRISGGLSAIGALTVFLRDQSSIGGGLVATGTAQLLVSGARIGGDLSDADAIASGFGHAQVCGASVGGALTVTDVGPDILIGDPGADCQGNSVGRGLSLTRNVTAGELQVAGNTVHGDLVVQENTGTSPKTVQNNSGSGQLICSGNAAPFVGSPNGPFNARTGVCS
ncbi:MAG TPA: hypothetical protein VNV65_00070 [Candidatus Solibacter sp.]|jgi:hypothetical protein|nr:hypothetical protein [Candidatus Solibacter sp.]